MTNSTDARDFGSRSKLIKAADNETQSAFFLQGYVTDHQLEAFCKTPNLKSLVVAEVASALQSGNFARTAISVGEGMLLRTVGNRRRS